MIPFLQADFGHPAIFSNISRKIKLNTFSFQLKDLL